MEIRFTADEATIRPDTYGSVDVVVDNPNLDNIFSNLKVSDVIDYFDDGDVLDHIGIDRVMQYFDLVERK